LLQKGDRLLLSFAMIYDEWTTKTGQKASDGRDQELDCLDERAMIEERFYDCKWSLPWYLHIFVS
jgi:hypothetical protein